MNQNVVSLLESVGMWYHIAVINEIRVTLTEATPQLRYFVKLLEAKFTVLILHRLGKRCRRGATARRWRLELIQQITLGKNKIFRKSWNYFSMELMSGFLHCQTWIYLPKKWSDLEEILKSHHISKFCWQTLEFRCESFGVKVYDLYLLRSIRMDCAISVRSGFF